LPARLRPGNRDDVLQRLSPARVEDFVPPQARKPADETAELPEQGGGEGAPAAGVLPGEGALPEQGGEQPGSETGAPANAPAATTDAGALERLRAELQQQHQAEMALLRDSFERQLDRVMSTFGPVVGQRSSLPPDEPPSDIDPDIQPGKYFGPKVSTLEAQMAEFNAWRDGERVRRNAEMVDGHLRGLAEYSPVFRGRKALAENLLSGIRESMLSDPSVTTSNWQAHAAKRFKDVETRLAPELQPMQAHSAKKAAAVKATMAAAPKAVPLGAGASTPAPGVPQPKGNWSDPEVRKARFEQFAREFEASQG